MRDEIDARVWGENHHHFSADVARLIEAVRVALCRVNRIRWDAPWRARTPGSC